MLDAIVATLFYQFTRLYSIFDKPWQTRNLLFLLLCLSGTSVVFIYSASLSTSSENGGWGAAYMVKQLVYFLIGFVMLSALQKVPLERIRQLSLAFMAVTLLCLIAVLIPGIGRTVNGASRWIGFGLFNVQPSEMAKLSMAIFMADFCTRKRETIRSTNPLYMRSVLIPLVVVLSSYGALLLLEPDFGSTTVVFVITLGLMAVAGLRKRLIAVMALVAATGASVLIVTSPYRVQRFLGFMDPWADPYGKSYQLTHSLMAYGRGELFGTGLGTSLEAQFYLPEAHTDFISAIIAEETGFLGVALLLSALLFLVMQCLAIGRAAIRQDKLFAGLLCLGIGIWFAFQTVVNVGVAMGSLPTKGITLPLISYGGSGVILNLIAFGMVLRANWENNHQTGSTANVLFDLRRGKRPTYSDWDSELENKIKILKDPEKHTKKQAQAPQDYINRADLIADEKRKFIKKAK